MKLVNELNHFEAKKIKIIISDFDGVFTDNCVYTDEVGRESVRCNKYDSIGTAQLAKTDIELVVVSSEKNISVQKRCEKLNLLYFTGVDDKGVLIANILAERSFNADQALYLGNDLNDIPALDFVGFKVAVRDSHPSFIAACDFITEKKGGEGCIREICDILIERKQFQKDVTMHKHNSE